MADDTSRITDTPCRPGHERCAVDGVVCECEQIELERFAHGLVRDQEPLGREFEKVLYDNLEALYVRS